MGTIQELFSIIEIQQLKGFKVCNPVSISQLVAACLDVEACFGMY